MKIEGYLSQKAQALYPKSVIVNEDGIYVLRIEGKPSITLGTDFQQAKMSVYAMLRQDIPLLSQHHLEAYNLLVKMVDVVKARYIIPELDELISKAERVFEAEEARQVKKQLMKIKS